MYLDKINSIYNFNNNVVRNSPLFNTDTEDLNDLVDDQFDIDVAKKTIDKKREIYFRKIDYHAIDYIFNQTHAFKSRFSDGTYPVWYASLDEETTFCETAFHWHRRIIEDIHYSDETPIVTNRSLFSVDCNAILIDLRKLINQIPELIDSDLESYKVTQTLSKEIHDHGQTGLYTLSARKDNGENIAVYNRKALGNADHLKDVKYRYDFSKSKIYVIDTVSDEVLVEI